jgi:hypothetical protein
MSNCHWETRIRQLAQEAEGLDVEAILNHAELCHHCAEVLDALASQELTEFTSLLGRLSAGTCPGPEHLVSAYAGEYPEAMARSIQQHVASCSSCTEDWRLLVTMHDYDDERSAQTRPALPPSDAAGPPWTRPPQEAPTLPSGLTWSIIFPVIRIPRLSALAAADDDECPDLIPPAPVEVEDEAGTARAQFVIAPAGGRLFLEISDPAAQAVTVNVEITLASGRVLTKRLILEEGRGELALPASSELEGECTVQVTLQENP